MVISGPRRIVRCNEIAPKLDYFEPMTFEFQVPLIDYTIESTLLAPNGCVKLCDGHFIEPRYWMLDKLFAGDRAKSAKSVCESPVRSLQ
jgi:hypothetical protein